LPLYAKCGVENAKKATTPSGMAVYKIHGRNLPHFEFVLSASTPMIGLKRNAASKPTTSIMIEASVFFSP
jgi:hypothetical protein